MGNSIQDIINKALLKEQEDRAGRQRSGKWSPSSFGYCYRRQYWNRKNETPSNPIDERTLRVFKAGKLFHDFVQNYIPDQSKEVKVDKDDILGYADIVTKDSVIDIKSVHSKAFWYMEKSNYDVKKEKENNWIQVATYAWILGKEWVRLMFISKDDLCIAEYAFPTKEFIPKVEEELKILRGYWEKEEVPPAKPRCYNGKECKYCQFLGLCSDFERGEGRELPFKPKTPPKASNSPKTSIKKGV